MNIMWQYILKIVALMLVMVPGSVEARPYVSFLSTVVRSANTIAVVQIGSTTVHESEPTAEYAIKVERVIEGGVRDGCVTGPPGLKSGKRYIVFMNNDSHGQSHCDNPSIIHRRGPIALEVERLSDIDDRLSDVDNVKLDIFNLMVPAFPDSSEMKQVFEEDDGTERITIVGTVVPLTSFIEYIHSTREERR